MGEDDGSGLDEAPFAARSLHLDRTLPEEGKRLAVEDPLGALSAALVEPGDRDALAAGGVGGVVDEDDAGDLGGGPVERGGQPRRRPALDEQVADGGEGLLVPAAALALGLLVDLPEQGVGVGGERREVVVRGGAEVRLRGVAGLVGAGQGDALGAGGAGFDQPAVEAVGRPPGLPGVQGVLTTLLSSPTVFT